MIFELKLRFQIGSPSDSISAGGRKAMGNWYDDKRKKQEQDNNDRERRGQLLAGLASAFFSRLDEQVESDVEGINKAYSNIYNRHTNSHLAFMGGISGGFEVRCGVNTPLVVKYSSNPPSLMVTRRLPKNRLGESKTVGDYYFFKLDKQDNLYIETKEGKPIPTEEMSQELLDFLTEV
jgi:hypothetical protein